MLGELGGYETGSAHRSGVSEFVDALPQALVCEAAVWSVHSYVSFGGHQLGRNVDPAGALEQALRRRGCQKQAPIWITETGAGAPDPGHPRDGTAAQEDAGCLALAAQLGTWSRDPSVAAVFQYTFREDPAFAVGLISADLTHLYPAYSMWRALAGGAEPVALSAACE